MTSGLAGYIAVGSGRFPLARAYCAEAYHLASAANDSALQAWVRATQSFCEYYAGKYQRAVDLALDGLTYAGTGPQGVRLMINGAARAYGKLGDYDGVQRTVEQAYESMTHNDVPSGMPSSIGLNCYSRAQTASNAATAYVSLGRPHEVQQYAALALPEIHASASPWSRSLLTLDLASAQIRTKDADLDQACQLALDALARSSHRPVISVTQRATDLADAAAERWGEIRQVHVLREAIASGERGSA
jgi:tetratricopeptide (TPR) repeat protein